jgi:hypothetical protein
MPCQRPLLAAWLALLAASVHAAECPTTDILRTPTTLEAIAYEFSPEGAKLLDEVEHACFLYFWKEVGEPAGLVKDRMLAPVSSVAAVGFQLSALPIGVERGWISREEGEKRALSILRALEGRTDNRRFGVFLHYPDHHTGGPSDKGFEVLCSTVDHALFLAGAIPAGQYFGGEVAQIVDRRIAETNWRAFLKPDGWLSMGWRPDDKNNVEGSGKLIEHKWHLASDEERLIYFLAVAAPNPDFALEPEAYYRLKRPVKGHEDMPPYVVSWPGTLFTYFFSHCWIDYRSLPADDPRQFGIDAPRVDWFENSRRAILTHRQRCIEQANRYKTLAPDRWGLSACTTCEDGYIVPQVKPNLADRDEWHEGTVTPYAAGSAIMFAPAEAVAALRAMRELKRPDGEPFVWRDPAEGGFGFLDSFNLDKNKACEDYVGIDQGPMLLAIENARTGLIWKLFMSHPTAQRAVERLKLKPQ